MQIYARACAESRDDIRDASAGTPVNYNLDFSLLRPVLFTSGSAENTASARATWRVLEPRSGRQLYRLVISGLTLIEFFDQLEHRTSHLQQSRPELYAAVPQRLLGEALATSAELRARLAQFTESGIEHALMKPISELDGLLRRGVLSGMGDLVNGSALMAATDEREYLPLFEEQRARRLPRDDRALQDSEFHYGIDVRQAMLTRAMARSEGPVAYFVTDTQTNLDQCLIGGRSFARLDLTPLFVRNALASREGGLIDDEADFLDDVAAEALALEERLRRHTGKALDEVPRQLRIRVARFLEDDIITLSRTERKAPEQDPEGVEQILETFARPGRIRVLVEDAVENAGAAARRLESDWAEMDVTYAARFDLDDDPVVARLRERLGVMQPRPGRPRSRAVPV
jgi:hypothetical protein